MGNNMEHSLKQIKKLFESQRLAVLSTQNKNQPYLSLVAFVADDKLEYIFFLTPSTTHKYENLITNPKVSILINNSLNQADDIYKAVSVTGIGSAALVETPDKAHFLNMYLKKHPHLKEFSKAPTTALICVAMKRYFMVNQFQNVIEIPVTS